MKAGPEKSARLPILSALEARERGLEGASSPPVSGGFIQFSPTTWREVTLLGGEVRLPTTPSWSSWR